MSDNTVRYGKPSMTNLPYELGRHIIDQIMSSPKPDFTELHKTADEAREELLQIRERRKSEQKSQ